VVVLLVVVVAGETATHHASNVICRPVLRVHAQVLLLLLLLQLLQLVAP
jgi:hypothetical protein